jgi:hypothetical protein
VTLKLGHAGPAVMCGVDRARSPCAAVGPARSGAAAARPADATAWLLLRASELHAYYASAAAAELYSYRGTCVRRTRTSVRYSSVSRNFLLDTGCIGGAPV